MKAKRRDQLARKRAAKGAAFARARAAGVHVGRSAYAQKIRRKLGSGRVEPGWIWWIERGPNTHAHRVVIGEP